MVELLAGLTLLGIILSASALLTRSQLKKVAGITEKEDLALLQEFVREQLDCRQTMAASPACATSTSPLPVGLRRADQSLFLPSSGSGHIGGYSVRATCGLDPDFNVPRLYIFAAPWVLAETPSAYTDLFRGVPITCPDALPPFAASTVDAPNHGKAAVIPPCPGGNSSPSSAPWLSINTTNAVTIKTQSDLEAMAPNGVYVLANDISLDPSYQAPGLSGVQFSGGGYTLTSSIPVFTSIDGSIVDGLTVAGVSFGGGGALALSVTNSTLSNLTVTSPGGQGGGPLGGVVGTAMQTTFFMVSVSSPTLSSLAGGTVGGVAGSAAQSVFNSITVTNPSLSVGTGGREGGIVGWASTDDQFDTINVVGGNITATGTAYLGGVSGYLGDGSSVTNASNSARVGGGAGPVQAGGIIGEVCGNVSIKGAKNSGPVSGSGNAGFAGGIVGLGFARPDGHGQLTVNGANAAIVGQSGTAGGLVGSYDGVLAISGSNSGAITALTDAGGIIGRSSGLQPIQSATLLGITATNQGTIQASDPASGVAGGLIGRADGTTALSQSVNSGAVSARVAGGLGGYIAFGSVDSSPNKAAISGTGPVGGLVGYTGEFLMIVNSDNWGDVTASESPAGPFIGTSPWNDFTVNSINHGAVRWMCAEIKNAPPCP